MRVIVINNIKGGCGKTTLAINIISALADHSVCSLDADVNQFSLTRFMENRANNQKNYPSPRHFQLKVDYRNQVYDFSKEDCLRQIVNIFEELKNIQPDFLIIDTPAGDTFISDIILNYADQVITPINESLIDLDLILQERQGQIFPGIYSQKIWQKKASIEEEFNKQLDWYIIRNRIAPMRSKSSNTIAKILEENQEKIGYSVLKGFHERVIFKELFNHGITLLDLISYENIKLSPSHLAAKQELRNFMKILLHAEDLQEKEQVE